MFASTRHTGQPESYYHGEGRVALTGDKPAFQYKLTDHLGNTMVLFEDRDGDGIITTESMNSNDPVEVLQRNFYYAFGLPMQGPWNHAPADPDMPYLYNGKELEGELGLGWYAYGFRYYDASVGRFVGVDPLAGQMPDWSPYGYAYSNPISFIDFMGLAPTDPPDSSEETKKTTTNGGYCQDCYQYTSTVIPEVTSSRIDRPDSSVQANKKSTWGYALSRNRFDDWQSTGTGYGLSVNPNYPQYSEYAEGVKQFTWDILSPVLLGVAGSGGAGTGGAGQLIKRSRDYISLALRFRQISAPRANVFSYVDEISNIAIYPLNRAPRGGMMVGGKFYKGGQFLPAQRFVSGRQFSNVEYLSSSPLSNSLRPSPVFYPSFSPAVRWGIGGGGAALGLYWGTNKNKPE